MEKRILVVGGAGYVGSILTRELLEKGYAVRVLDCLYFGDAGLRDVRDLIDLTVGDMRTMDPSVLDGITAVIHVGGLSNDPMAEYNPEANHELNTVATKTLADLCVAHGVKRFLFASSCSIYDRGVGDGPQDVMMTEASSVEPRAAYSSSKYAAEKELLAMGSGRFCPVILRKGTVYGFSPRMRYDLVVNTFVKEALSKGIITIFHGGEMWRPLVDVHDVARAYLAVLNAPEEKVKGEIFNVSFFNVRISELALRVREALRSIGVAVDIRVDYAPRSVRSYRVSPEKIQKVLNFRAEVPVEDSVKAMVEKIRKFGFEDFSNPRYYNIEWMRWMEEEARARGGTGLTPGPAGRRAKGGKMS